MWGKLDSLFHIYRVRKTKYRTSTHSSIPPVSRTGHGQYFLKMKEDPRAERAQLPNSAQIFDTVRCNMYFHTPTPGLARANGEGRHRCSNSRILRSEDITDVKLLEQKELVQGKVCSGTLK